MKMDAAVPSRIVLLGTSKISLNERFSQVAAPDTRNGIATVRRNFSTNDSSEQRLVEPVLSRTALIVDDLEEDSDDLSADLQDSAADYDDSIRFVPRHRLMLYQKPRYAHVPILNRISFPVQRNRFSNDFRRSIDRPRAFGSLRYASRNTHFVRNGSNNTFWRSRFTLQRTRASRSRINNRSFSRSFTRNIRPVKTKEELDKEIEEYMKKGKHPQVSVSGLK